MRNCDILSDIYTLGLDKQAQIVGQLNRKYDWPYKKLDADYQSSM